MLANLFEWLRERELVRGNKKTAACFQAAVHDA